MGPLCPYKMVPYSPTKRFCIAPHPSTRWCLMPRLRNGAQPTHDPTISSSPDQTLKSENNILLNPNIAPDQTLKSEDNTLLNANIAPDQTLKSEDNILLNATQTRIKSTIESRLHDCNQLEYP